MRTYQRRFYPSCRSCGVVITRGDCCDDCMAEQYSGDVPTCEAHGCTREVGSSERLCQAHVALAAGEPPRLYTWQVDEVYRQLGDQADPWHAHVMLVALRLGGIRGVHRDVKPENVPQTGGWWRGGGNPGASERHCGATGFRFRPLE